MVRTRSLPQKLTPLVSKNEATVSDSGTEEFPPETQMKMKPSLPQLQRQRLSTPLNPIQLQNGFNQSQMKRTCCSESDSDSSEPFINQGAVPHGSLRDGVDPANVTGFMNSYRRFMEANMGFMRNNSDSEVNASTKGIESTNPNSSKRTRIKKASGRKGSRFETTVTRISTTRFSGSPPTPEPKPVQIPDYPEYPKNSLPSFPDRDPLKVYGESNLPAIPGLSKLSHGGMFPQIPSLESLTNLSNKICVRNLSSFSSPSLPQHTLPPVPLNLSMHSPLKIDNQIQETPQKKTFRRRPKTPKESTDDESPREQKLKQTKVAPTKREINLTSLSAKKATSPTEHSGDCKPSSEGSSSSPRSLTTTTETVSSPEHAGNGRNQPLTARQKNTISARKSRHKKKAIELATAERADQLEIVNLYLRQHIAALTAQNETLRSQNAMSH